MAAHGNHGGLRRRPAPGHAGVAQGGQQQAAQGDRRPVREGSPRAAFGWMPEAMGQFAHGAADQAPQEGTGIPATDAVNVDAAPATGEQQQQQPCCRGQGEDAGTKGHHHRRHTADEEAQVSDDDMCSFDWGLLVEPVTLLCGHTFCRHCVGIMINDSLQKTRTRPGGNVQGTFKCPLCCRALPALLPQPNVRLRNDLKARYPNLYERRLKAAQDEFDGADAKAAGRAMTSDDLQHLINQHRRVADGAGLIDGDDDDDGDADDADDFVDPVLDVMDLFQAELSDIWKTLRPACWVLACFLLLFAFRPLIQAGDCITRPGAADAILRTDTWNAWWALNGNYTNATEPAYVCNGPSPLSENTAVFPGSELLATAYMYPAWGWVERASRGVEGCLLDIYRVIHKPTPQNLLSAFPGLAMAVYALAHPGWTLIFRIIVAFIAVEGEIRQFMAMLAVLTIPTRIPRDAHDIPPINEMPSYAWTVLSLTIAQGAYLVASEMLATLLDVAALAPMVLVITKGTYWRSEGSLCATVLVRLWLMLRDDLGLFRRWLGEHRSSSEAALLRGFIVMAVFSAWLWAGEPLYNSTDAVATLTHAGDELVTELWDEMGRTVST